MDPVKLVILRGGGVLTSHDAHYGGQDQHKTHHNTSKVDRGHSVQNHKDVSISQLKVTGGREGEGEVG